MILYVGDIHGKIEAVDAIDRFALKAGAEHVVSVGDFGVLWNPDPIGRYFRKRARQGRPGPTWYTCGGNHENWHAWLERANASDATNPLVELAPSCFYVRRGAAVTIDGLVHAMLGGAESSDRASRVQGKSWWPEETPSHEDFTRFFATLEDGLGVLRRADVIVTHDAPLETSTFDHGDREQQTTPRTLQRIVDMLTPGRLPPRWFFGHHHLLQAFKVGERTYYCCGLEGEGWAMTVATGPSRFQARVPARWNRGASEWP